MADDEKELAAARRLLRESAPKERYNWSENLSRQKDAEGARKKAAEVLGQQTVERSYEDDAPEEQKAAVMDDRKLTTAQRYVSDPMSAVYEDTLKPAVDRHVQRATAERELRSPQEKLDEEVRNSRITQNLQDVKMDSYKRDKWAMEHIPGFADAYKKLAPKSQEQRQWNKANSMETERQFLEAHPMLERATRAIRQFDEDTRIKQAPTRDPVSIERTFSSDAEKQAYLHRLQEAAKASRGQ